MKRYFYQVQNETEKSITSAPRSRPSNRDLLRSGGNRQHHRKYYKKEIFKNNFKINIAKEFFPTKFFLFQFSGN